ncbi:MAG: hypothetical protein M1812_003567 [Candelaria pacifica]|nr:MAG: hypothetical protein M1812_003567 [Candelaria pacifica]
MTNSLPHGSSGAPPSSYSSAPGSGSSLAPRRSSYASVAAGTASSQPQNHNQISQAGSISHLMNPSPADYHTRQQPSNQISRQAARNLDGEMHSSGQSIGSEFIGRRGNLPSYSSQFGSLNDYVQQGDALPGYNHFFTPSYLRSSRYVEDLAEAYKVRVAAFKDGMSAQISNGGTLSTSSSSANLHKMAPSHRGMTYDIVENHPPLDDDEPRPLPSRWNDADKFTGLEVQGDGLEVRFAGPSKSHEHEAAALRANYPMPPECGIYYYEVTVVSKGKEGLIGVGFSGPKVMLSRLPGWETDSWAYHGDDGFSFCCHSTGKPYGQKFSASDVIGCGVNFRTRSAFFTKNGVNIGIAFKELKSIDLYPSVGMKKPGEHLKVNFGQTPFVFDIDGMMAREKMIIQQEINATSTASLQPPLDETRLVQELVAQFLAHDGYVETAKAFTQETWWQKKIMMPSIDNACNLFPYRPKPSADSNAGIRASILEGDIDKALKHTNAYYPHVLKDNEQIYFRLRCRKFVEMIRKCADLQTAPSERQDGSANGHSNRSYDEVFEHEMELDEQAGSADEWDRMETEEADNSVKYHNLLQDTLEYGQELQLEFRDDGRREVKWALEETFSLLAYTDPRTSVVAHLLEPSGRLPVAEELNSAILVSLGKSSSAALERLYQQTEILVDDLSEDGGVGAFINVRQDFLS